VFHEVDAAEARVPFAASVPRKAPERGEHLRVPRIAPIDLDVQRAVAVVAFEQHGARRLHRRRCEVVDQHSEFGQRQLDPRLGRATARRAKDEMGDGGRERADEDRRERTR
jgi:hypothetical protein